MRKLNRKGIAVINMMMGLMLEEDDRRQAERELGYDNKYVPSHKFFRVGNKDAIVERVNSGH